MYKGLTVNLTRTDYECDHFVYHLKKGSCLPFQNSLFYVWEELCVMYSKHGKPTYFRKDLFCVFIALYNFVATYFAYHRNTAFTLVMKIRHFRENFLK